MKSVLWYLLLLALVFCMVPRVYALEVISFSDIDLSTIKYTNRVCLSNNLADEDFLSGDSSDTNLDGSIDTLEENSFVSEGESASFFVGNQHSSYALYNVALWLGIDGAVDSFAINSVEVTAVQMIPANDPSIIWPASGLDTFIDKVVLLETGVGIASRHKNEPVSTCGPLSFEIVNVVSLDASVRMYGAAFGAVKSGYNSVTPANSDLLFMPTIGHSDDIPGIPDDGIDEGGSEDPATQPVPEPTTFAVMACGCCMWWWKKKCQ